MKLIIEMCPIALILATPLIIAGLGGFWAERSGVVNIALEGIMVMGGFAGAGFLYVFSVGKVPGALWLSLLLAIVVGMIFSTLLGFAAIHMKSDQTITGTSLNIMAGGLAIYLCEIIFGAKNTPAYSLNAAFNRISVPVLKDIPVVGEILFTDNYPTLYIAVGLVLLTWFVAYKTPFGIHLRSCGEYPQASASMGISVTKMRWIGVILSGALASFAGAVSVITNSQSFYAGSIHGLGFIAIATLIFGRWNPWGILGAGLFFGFSQTLGYYSTTIPFFLSWPGEFFAAFPYITTVIVLILTSGKTVGPKAAGQIYDAGKR